MKSEPEVYGIEALERDGTTHWDGVRNYQARNFMRDDMQIGDLVLFYHSNASPPGIAGIARVARPGYPDHTSWDPADKHFDPKTDPETPRWIMVDIEHVETLPRLVALDELRQNALLDGMPLLQRGQRLSVQPVEERHFHEVLRLARS